MVILVNELNYFDFSEDLEDKKQCHCDPCRRKRNVLKTGDNWGRWKKRFT